jgi:hypothetical protein
LWDKFHKKSLKLVFNYSIQKKDFKFIGEFKNSINTGLSLLTENGKNEFTENAGLTNC